jgi:hypothetical protein
MKTERLHRDERQFRPWSYSLLWLFSRKQVLAYTAKLASVLVGIEACSGAHFIGAALRGQGHDVRLIPGAVREALSKVEQERLPRCRSHRRSGDPQEHALRADQDRRSAGSAGAASGAGSSRPSDLSPAERKSFSLAQHSLRQRKKSKTATAKKALLSPLLIFAPTRRAYKSLRSLYG